MMRLHDAGKVDVEGSVRDYLPEFALVSPHEQPLNCLRCVGVF